MEKSFVLDSSLGKLAKWLRILGFDALYCPGAPDMSSFSFSCTEENRILLTRAEKIRDENPGFHLIFIRSNDFREQLRQVVKETGLSFPDISPFSRCVRCNLPVEPIPRENVRGKVPDYVFETRRTFRRCPGCERIFWSGTHNQKVLEIIRELFESHRI